MSTDSSIRGRPPHSTPRPHERHGSQPVRRSRHGGHMSLQSQRITESHDKGLRSAADDLAGGTAKAGFTRKTAVERAGRGDAMVLRAVARAKLGDDDAIRYLYLRYSDN